MQIPVQVTFRGTPVMDDVEAFCHREAEKLERYFDRITGCQVTVEPVGHRHRTGEHWRIHVRLTVPGREIVVNRDPAEHEADEKLDLALRETFDRARRKLQDHARRVDARVKHHEGLAQGRVVRLDGLNRCGFVEATDGTELYFHRNALVEGSFDELEIGTELRFVPEQGVEGPQATSVRAKTR